jgi:hypothetical protein
MTLNLDGRAAGEDPVAARTARLRARSRRRISTRFVAAIVTIAAVEAGVIGWLARARWFAPRPPVSVETSASGEHVLVAGESGNPAPLALAVGPDLGWIRVTAAPSAGVLGKKTAQTSGATLRIWSPIELKVLEGSRLLGSIPGRDLDLAAGRHEIALVNEALGYSAQQTIEVQAGQTIAIHVAPSPGWVTVNAPGAPEVSIDGQPVGRVPLGPLALTPGEHQVTFTHAGGRADRQRITIKTGETMQVVGKTR